MKPHQFVGVVAIAAVAYFIGFGVCYLAFRQEPAPAPSPCCRPAIVLGCKCCGRGCYDQGCPCPAGKCECKPGAKCDVHCSCANLPKAKKPGALGEDH